MNNDVKYFFKNKRWVIINLLSWLCIYAFFVAVATLAAPSGDRQYKALTIFALIVFFVFYVNFYACILFLPLKKVKYFLSVVFILIIVFSLDLVVYFAVESKNENQVSLFQNLIVVSIYSIIVILISTCIWALSNSTKSKKESFIIQLQLENKNLQLQEEAILLKTELLNSQINYLRAQINPHFLFNCLNFFYAESLEAKPKLSEGIIMLSEIMRYSLKDFTKTGGMANLEDELMHIDNVIKINQMRFDDNLNISLAINGNVENIKIAPMILITLVENIFKHGDLHNTASPAKIICTIDEQKSKVIFSTSNKIKIGTVAPSSGIGIENIEQRLIQLYDKDYTFKHAIEDNLFFVEIQFPYFKNDQKIIST